MKPRIKFIPSRRWLFLPPVLVGVAVIGMLAIDGANYQLRAQQRSADLAQARAQLTQIKLSWEADQRSLEIQQELLQVRQKDVDRIQQLTKRSAASDSEVDSQRTNVLEILNELRQTMLPELTSRHRGLEITFKGEAERGAEIGTSLARAAIIGCLGVFVILSFQFRSYVEPLVVMVAIPFAFVGVVWAIFCSNSV